MATTRIQVERFSLVSAKSFDEVVAKLAGGVGHTNIAAFGNEIRSAKTYAEVEKVVLPVVGAAGLMEFMRFDLGEILRKERGDKAPRSLRFVIGNPLIMKQLVEHAPDAGSYAPVTILVDERRDGVHLSYDTMASYLASYGSAEASKVARDLDAKIEALLKAAAA